MPKVSELIPCSQDSVIFNNTIIDTKVTVHITYINNVTVEKNVSIVN